ncbi:MAG: PaaI family thioesterase, partial [Rickettsiales bacterium]
MNTFTARDPNFAARIRDSFVRQPFMETVGATLSRVEPGRVEIEAPFADHITQQHGFVHGGVVGAIADSAAGYAAYTLMAAEDS